MRYLFIVSLLTLVLVSCSEKNNETIQVKQSNITQSVYASGTVKAENQYTVYATVSGVLKKINASVGQSIAEGQPLFAIESDKAALNTENARLAYQLSQEGNRYTRDKIAELENKVQLAKDRLALDQSIYNRNRNIKQYNVISEVEYEKVETAYKNSKSNYESAVRQLSQLREQLKNEQSRNNVNLRINQKAESDYTVKSAVSGELFDVLVKEGALVTPQLPLAVIGKKNAYLLELDVDENDMVHVALGQKIAVTLDSYKGKAFDATVDRIYRIMDERSRTFKIEAHFDNPPGKLYPNLTAEANIIIQTKKNVITIPKAYVLKGDSVWVDGDKKRKIKIGLSDYQNVEILDGLQTGETIHKPK